MSMPQFENACQEAVTCGFVLSQSHIREILKNVAGTPSLLSIVQGCVEGYDFDYQFNRSKAPVSTSEYRLVPPTDVSDFVAYCFGLLYHIDVGSIELANLLTTYYQDSDINISYQRFALEIIDRFGRTLGTMWRERASRDKSMTAAQERNTVIIDGDAVSQAVGILTECINKILALPVDIRTKEELLVECDGLKKVLAYGDKPMIYVVYVGFKYAVLSSIPELAPSVGKVESLLAANGLI